MSTIENMVTAQVQMTKMTEELQGRLLDIAKGDDGTRKHLHGCLDAFNEAMTTHRARMIEHFETLMADQGTEIAAAVQTLRDAVDEAISERQAALSTAMSAPTPVPETEAEQSSVAQTRQQEAA